MNTCPVILGHFQCSSTTRDNFNNSNRRARGMYIGTSTKFLLKISENNREDCDLMFGEQFGID